MASVQIDIKATDNTKAGFDSAVANAQKAEQAFSRVGGGAGVASGLMQGWTKSQFAAAQAGSLLTERAIKLGNAVNAGNMTIAQATREYKAYEGQMKRSVFQAMSFSEKYGLVSQRINSVAGSIVSGAAKFGAIAAAAGVAGKAVYSFARSGAEIEYTRQKFDRLTASVGDTGNAFLQNLRGATKGTVSDFALLRQGSDLLQLGLAKDTKEATRLSSVMTALGMDTGELTLALANQSKRRLDQLGLSLTAFNKIESKLRESGMSKQDAFKEAFLQTAEQTVSVTGNRADSTLGSYLQLQAQATNVWDSAKQQMSTALAPDVQNFANFFKAMNAVQNQDMAWTGNIFEMMTQPGPVIRQGMASDYSDLWAGGGRTSIGGGRGPGGSAAITGLSATQSYTAMAYAARNQGGPGLSAEEIAAQEVNYELMFEGSLKVTQQTDKFKNATSELNSQLMEQTVLLQETAKKYGVNSEKAKEAYAALQDTQEQMQALNEAQRATGGGFVMENLAGMGADPQTMLDFALAAGMVTEEAHAAQTAYLGVAEAINTGVTSAGMGAQLAGNIAGQLGRLDGETFTTYVDVIVNWIGNSKIFGGAGGLNQANQAAVQNCFIPDTLISMSDGSQKPIQDIETGDLVLSYNTDTKQVFRAQVGKVFKHAPEDMGEYYLLINERIGVTPNHPLYINGEWQNAEVIAFGDSLLTPDGVTSVRSLTRIYRQVTTYNLHIDDDNHNYFADGVLAHNKAEGGRVSAPGDGTRDTILVPLANGEYVINAQAARSLGYNFLENLNDGRIMGLATGGSAGTTGGGTRYRTRSRGKRLPTGSTRVGGGGGGGDGAVTSAVIDDAIGTVIPEIADVVSGTVAQTLASSAQMSALEGQLAAQREQVEILTEILEKMASAGDIGRAVHGRQALQA